MSSHRIVAFTSAVVLGGALAFGCKKEEKATTAAIPQEAQDIFNQRCATCHGADGKGDGPGAAALNPKPRDYTDPAWQASITDEQLKTVIVKGGPAVGKSPLMPPNPDLEGKPEVVDGLVAKIRSFKK